MSTAITNVRVFDGEQVLPHHTVVVDGHDITAVGGPPPEDATVVDGRGGTLLPGLIDAHVHTSVECLRLALTFGVTTELEMMGYWTVEQRAQVAADDGVADVRSALLGLTAPGGHPTQLADESHGEWVLPTVSTPREAKELVAQRVAEGADYIKVMIEEGSVLKSPGLPQMSAETLAAGVEEAHRLGKQVVAHTLTLEATQQAVDAGVDGLAHLFVDRPHTPEIIAAIADAGMFVTPCLMINASLLGHSAAAFAADERVRNKLSPEWFTTLSGTFNAYPEGDFADVLATVVALRDAGVDVLVGTDAHEHSGPIGGHAHGASVHHELQLLVRAGFTPIEALRAATTVSARRFGLTDRGTIAPGARADLVLVDGDPTTDISATLSIRDVWRRGARLAA
ncbi:amidohydrolase family protein [Actinocrispum wychmicini]|uniref:Imidazolonepropionase-like amidohydrolase n=1 Tax=Actinocrispum wychmicini TaxID=1213861 RepID=A0A4R2K5C0_9PSEU|nr:amidohydrolase family protein [Actinocrispum wychmicini]TCO65029.1 imidazolonepropionase-like amidohydrolase [Actinocrispum wychmicini]